MPRRDGTGPLGNGPMTGWGNGYCMTTRPAGLGRGIRRGLGRGLGRGAGRGLGFGPGAAMGQGMALEEERKILQKRLDMINAQLENETKEE